MQSRTKSWTVSARDDSRCPDTADTIDFVDEITAGDLSRSRGLMCIGVTGRMVLWRVEGVSQQVDVCLLQRVESL